MGWSGLISSYVNFNLFYIIKKKIGKIMYLINITSTKEGQAHD